MKSTYSTTIVASISYPSGNYEVTFAFPAAVDCYQFDQFLEDIESLTTLPEVNVIEEVLEAYYFDDIPDITITQH